VEKIEYYQNYSIPQERWIRANGIKYLRKGTNPNTGRIFFVYEMTDELSDVLEIWTNNKKKKD
jgi:uncharacterized protein (DUF1015 family)